MYICDVYEEKRDFMLLTECFLQLYKILRLNSFKLSNDFAMADFEYDFIRKNKQEFNISLEAKLKAEK